MKARIIKGFGTQAEYVGGMWQHEIEAIPRVGEFMAFDGKFYEVTRVVHMYDKRKPLYMNIRVEPVPAMNWKVKDNG